VDITEIIKAVKSGRVNVTAHAREEARDDVLLLDDIFFSVNNGEIIENYPNDKPYPSCLIYGMVENGNPIHSVWAYSSESRIAILITVYRPNPKSWINWKERMES
jgi:hypothetical protein